jgi:hypothetical protein
LTRAAVLVHIHYIPMSQVARAIYSMYIYVCMHTFTDSLQYVYVCMYVRLHMYVCTSTHMCTSLYSITYPYTHMHVIYTRHPNFLTSQFHPTTENVTENVAENFAENIVENVSENMLQCRQCYRKLPTKILSSGLHNGSSEHRTSHIEHRTSNITHRTSKIGHRTSHNSPL